MSYLDLYKTCCPVKTVRLLSIQEQYIGNGVSSEIRNEFWSCGEYELVGHGKQTNAECGKFKRFDGCPNVEAHNNARWFTPDLPKDAVYVRSVYHSCDKPTCPKCFKYGWAVRQATRMEKRLKEASTRFGLVEHIVVSVPQKEYAFSLEALRKRAVKILANRGIIGGSMIFHAFRYRNERVARKTGLPIGWYWNPHFHVLGFVGGEGYGKCRRCKGADCYACNGFEGVTRSENKKDEWIVKVLDKRKSVGGTAWYQLNHASIRCSDSKNSHAATWFGVCSYRKLKLINGKDVGIKHECPICGGDLVRVRYLGDFSEVSVSRRREILNMFDADGEPLWEVVTERKYEGG
jgi:hypothetical protein